MPTLFKKQHVTKDPKTGQESRHPSSCWHIAYRTADGISRRVRGYEDKARTIKLAVNLGE